MLRTCCLQIPSGYYIQTMNSNLHLDDLLLPIGIMNVISILPLLLLAPLIECVTTCFLSMGKTPVAPAKVISESFFVHTHANVNRILMSSPGYYCILCSYVSFILPVSSPSVLLIPQPPLLLPLPVCHSLAALGHVCATVSVLVAGLSELRRKSYPLVEQTLSGKVLQVSSMPCFELTPQYILLGLAEALVTPSCEQQG